jgi:hypothetical protein
VDPSAIVLDSVVVTDASGVNESDGTIVLTIHGGSEPYTIVWNNGSTGAMITNLSPGSYYYTLTDANGCLFASPDSILVSFITGIHDINVNSTISIIPNPTNGFITISSHEPGIFSKVSILNVTGMELVKMDFTSGMLLDMTNLSQGLYVVRLSGGKKEYYQKVIRL